MEQQQDDLYGAYTGEQDTDPGIEMTEAEPQTGPIGPGRSGFFDGMKNIFSRSQTPKPPKPPKMPRDEVKKSPSDNTGFATFFRTIFPEKAAPAADNRSAIEKMRDKVADYDEDYKDVGERILGFFVQLVGYMGPFALVIWVGSDLGKFFSDTMGVWPAYGLSYTIECVIAACTVAMGRAFAEVASGKPNYGKASMVVLIWLILNASSAFGLYLVITNYGQVSQGSIEQVSMVVRVVAVALADLGCSAVLMFKGRSIQKHIESMKKRATAIGELADAQRSIEEADKNAALREQMMKSTLHIQEELSEKIGEAVSMVMTNIVDKMEKALKDEDKNERGYGRR